MALTVSRICEQLQWWACTFVCWSTDWSVLDLLDSWLFDDLSLARFVKLTIIVVLQELKKDKFVEIDFYLLNIVMR